MLSTYDKRNLITQILQRLNCSVAQFSRITQPDCGLRIDSMQRLLRGDTLDQSNVDRLLEIARELEAIQDSLPCELDFRDVGQVRTLLNRRRELSDQQEYVEKRQRAAAAVECK